MKRLISFALVAALPLGACAHSPAPAALALPVEQEVLARFQSLAQSAEALDHDRYFSHFDRERFAILNADGTIEMSFDEFRDNYLAAMEPVQRYEALDFGKVSVQQLDADTVILLNEFDARLQLSNNAAISAAGGGLQVWQKISGEWMLVAIGSSTAD